MRLHPGFKLIAWGFLPLALLLGFTWPTTCRVKTTRRKPCGNAAYGFLFGCGKTPGHWRYKFLYRLQVNREVIKPLKPRKRAASMPSCIKTRPKSKPLKSRLRTVALAFAVSG